MVIVKIKELNIKSLSIFPLVFFLAHLIYRASESRAYEILWLCHLSNLTLFIALLLNNVRLIRVASLWLTIGSLCWIVDLLVFQDFSLSSTLAHIGGVTVALIAIFQVKTVKHAWIDAFIFGLLIQQFCRFFSPAEFNINVAHSIYPGMDKLFSFYWYYWLFNTFSIGFCLWFINLILRKYTSEN